MSESHRNSSDCCQDELGLKNLSDFRPESGRFAVIQVTKVQIVHAFTKKMGAAASVKDVYLDALQWFREVFIFSFVKFL